jgi:hypothetical protein
MKLAATATGTSFGAQTKDSLQMHPVRTPFVPSRALKPARVTKPMQGDEGEEHAFQMPGAGFILTITAAP